MLMWLHKRFVSGAVVNNIPNSPMQSWTSNSITEDSSNMGKSDKTVFVGMFKSLPVNLSTNCSAWTALCNLLDYYTVWVAKPSLCLQFLWQKSSKTVILWAYQCKCVSVSVCFWGCHSKNSKTKRVTRKNSCLALSHSVSPLRSFATCIISCQSGKRTPVCYAV